MSHFATQLSVLLILHSYLEIKFQGIPGWRSGLAPAFGPGRDPGDLGSNPTSGSRRGACFSLCLCLSLSLSLSLCVTIIHFKKFLKKNQISTKYTVFGNKILMIKKISCSEIGILFVFISVVTDTPY